MSNIELILLARVVHVMAGVTWAGATFLLAAVIVPIAVHHGTEGAGRWTGLVARKVGPISGVSALLTVLSGIYLFTILHSSDSSAAGIVLRIGAVAAFLSLATGFLIGRPAGLKLAKLSEQQSPTEALPADVSQKLSGLRLRAVLSSQFAAVLLVVAVLSMASFRYAEAIF